jgi:hypothetical protein
VEVADARSTGRGSASARTLMSGSRTARWSRSSSKPNSCERYLPPGRTSSNAGLPSTSGRKDREYRDLGQPRIHVSPYRLGTTMLGAMGSPDHDDSIRIIGQRRSLRPPANCAWSSPGPRAMNNSTICSSASTSASTTRSDPNRRNRPTRHEGTVPNEGSSSLSPSDTGLQPAISSVALNRRSLRRKALHPKDARRRRYLRGPDDP